MHLFNYALLLALLFISYTGWTKVSIHGKIHGYDGESVVYYNPTIEGIFTPWGKQVKPTPNGSFHIEFKNDGYGNTRVSYKGIVYRFFHDADSEIWFEIKERENGPRKRVPAERGFVVTDSIKQTLTLKIHGDYESINRFYNRNLRSSYFTTRMVDGNFYSHLIYNAATPSAAMALVDSLARIEIDQINRLPWQLNNEKPGLERKEKEIRKFLTNEVHAFYGAVFLNGMFLKRKEHVIKLMADSTATPDIYNRDWEMLVERLAMEMKENMKPIPNSADYADLMASMAYSLSAYRQYDFPQNPVKTLDEMVMENLFNYDTTLFQDNRSRFAYELQGLHRYLNDQLFFSPALLHAVYALQAKYPGSENLQYYESRIAKLKASLEASGRSFHEGKIIRTNYQSFEDLISRFTGKNVLVDLWATWCHPCIGEFKYKDQLATFVDKGEIELLYISIDLSQWSDRWRQSIKINQLAGSHYRADPEFIADMWHVIGDEQGAIPRYVLIDKHGKIYKRTAARPSQGSELAEQVASLIGRD